MIEYENLFKSNKIFADELENSFKKVLESGWFILGNEVRNFENSFSAFHETKYCIGVASGLDALILALRACDFPKDTEVIVPSNTYIATILSILHCGFKPILVEPDIRTYNIDPEKIEEKITAQTRAIMIVHLYGKSCAMDKISTITKKHNLILIEDCAQSHGAKFKNKLTGTFGEFGAFSFYPTKNLGALGDAGAIITNEDNFAATLKRLRNYGSDIKYYNEIVGYNSRLDELQAAFLNIKLRRLAEITEHKQRLANIYQQELKDDFIKPQKHEDYFDVFHIYNIRHQQRDKLKEYLLKNEIKTEIHYPVAPHKQRAMRGILDNQEFPISEEIHKTTLSLPISFGNTKEEIYRVIEAMNKF